MVKTRVYENRPEFYEEGYKKSKKRQAKQKEQKAKQVEAKEKALYTEAVFQFCKEWEEAHGIDRRGIVGEQYYSAFAQFNAYKTPECEKALEEAILALKMLKTWAMLPSKHSPPTECVHSSLGFVCPWGSNHCPLEFTRKYHQN